jgi:signal transduction histidine kinase
MSGLVDDLLSTARQRHRKVARETVDLDGLVTEVVADMAAGAKAASVSVEAVSGDPVAVIGERGALRRALMNLFDNAIRVSPRDATVRVGSGRRNRWGWLAVSDGGPGIEPGVAERMFERYQRGEEPDGNGAHLGLGLAIVRDVATAHGGEVRIVGRERGGTTFTIWLPLDLGDASPPPAGLEEI